MTQTNKVLDAYSKKKTSLNGHANADEPAAKKVARERAKAVTEKASQKTQEQVVKCLAELKLVLNESLDSISNQLTTEITSLHEVQEAITAEKAHLENLHGIVAEADSLQTLLLTQKEQKEEFEASMNMTKQTWAEELSQRNKAETERNLQLAKSRTWEQEQFSYERDKLRKLEQDEYVANRAKDQKVFDESISNRIAQLDVREKKILDQEVELKGLREAVAQAEQKILAEVNKHVAIATNSLKKDLNHEHTLAKMSLDNQLGLKAAEIASLHARVKELSEQNVELDSKYKAASDKVQQIAEKAIEGASRQSVVLQTPSNDSNGDARRK